MKVLRGRIISEVDGVSQWMEKLENYYSLKTGIKLFPTSLQVQIEGSLPLTVEEDSTNNLSCYINGIKGIVVASNESGVLQISPTTPIKELCFGEEVEVRIPLNEYVES